MRHGWILALAAAVAFVGWGVWARDSDALVVYCAHDSLYADEILKSFERTTGVPVRIRYDGEATKSLGLVEAIAREGASTPCDVFWNNEILGTLRLAEDGLLQPYRGPGFERIPAQYRDPDGRWVGFAARLRVYIVNTELVAASPAYLQALSRSGPAPDELPRTAIAKPLYGTTRAHYTVLWKALGGEGVQAWHQRWRAAGVREVTGNATVKNLVAAGTCALGLTDTDDYYLAVDAGDPVTMVPARVGDAVICIPNTVAITAACEQTANARQLVDYLLAAETERALANARSRQIPLGALDPGQVPPEVRELMPLVEQSWDLTQLGDARSETLSWLRTEYLR